MVRVSTRVNAAAAVAGMLAAVLTVTLSTWMENSNLNTLTSGAVPDSWNKQESAGELAAGDEVNLLPLDYQSQAPAANCTIGLPWIKNGQAGWVTAGHCATGEGEAYANIGRPGPASLVEPVGISQGTGDTHTDAVFLASYWPMPAEHIHTEDGAIPILGLRTATETDILCTQGISSQLTCGYTLQEGPHMRTLEDGHVYRVAEAKGKGTACTEKGDSGGPVFILEEGGAFIVGTITGGGTSGSLFGMEPRCELLYTSITDIQASLGGQLLVEKPYALEDGEARGGSVD